MATAARLFRPTARTTLDNLTSMGSVTNNGLYGAAVLAVIDGVGGGTFQGNYGGTWVAGTRGYLNCNGPYPFMVNTLETNTSAIQGGYQSWRFHADTGCTPQ